MPKHSHWLPAAYVQHTETVKAHAHLTDATIAAKLGVSAMTISGIRKNEQLPTPPPEWTLKVDWSKRSEEIAKAAGVSENTVKKWRTAAVAAAKEAESLRLYDSAISAAARK